MAWPPAASATTFTARLSTITTLAWGTDGIYASVIVKSVRASEMVEEANIANGSGLTAVQVGLKDGEQVEITVEDDRSITWPSFMGLVTLINPRPTGATGTSTVFQVIHNDYNISKKQNGERTLLCKVYTLITPS